MEKHSDASNCSSETQNEASEKSFSRGNPSLDTSSYRNLGSSPYHPNYESHPNIQTTNVPCGINLEEFGSPTSRGSSPSRKKTSSEVVSSNRRRSPHVSRKVTIGTEASYSTPSTGRHAIGSETSYTTSSSGRHRYGSNVEDEQPVLPEDRDLDGRSLSVVSSGSGDIVADVRRGVTDVDDSDGGFVASPNSYQKIKEVLEQVQAKIQKTEDLIKDEQRARDENVNEYLKLSTNADRQQLLRIKAVFEKKNQKSAAYILQLQKKLENYLKRKKDIEMYGIQPSHRPKEVLRDVGHGLKSVGGNIRDGISGFSGKAAFIGKPKELAHRIKNRFGSADNIKELGEDESEEKTHHGSATLPPNSGLHPTTSIAALATAALISTGTVGSSGGGDSAGCGTGGSAGGGGSSAGGKIGSEEGSECNSSVTSESMPGGTTIPMTSFAASPRNLHGLNNFDVNLPYVENLMQELQERQQENSRLKEDIDIIKQTLAVEVSHLKDCLMDERYRCERLEEQLNDLTELHQSEMENLKTSISEMEEKVQYQSEERIRDLHEIFEDCQNRVQRMEHQQAQQQQQFLTLEGLENSNARMLVVKLINILLTVLQVLLLIVATVAGILTPLLQTKTRLVSTATICLFFVFVYLQLAEIRASWELLVTRLTSRLSS